MKKLVILLLFLTSVTHISIGQVPLRLGLTISDGDTVGENFGYYIKEKIAGSSFFKRNYDSNVGLKLIIVTVPIEQTSLSAYSYTITFGLFEDNPVEYYLSSGVGYCGSEKTEAAAESVLSDVMEIADNIREVLNNQ